MKKALSTILGLVLLALLIAATVWVFKSLFSWFGSLKSDVAIAMIAASVTIFTSTTAVVLGRYLESKKEREAAHRDKKVLLYDELTERLFKIFQGGTSDKSGSEGLSDFLREVQRKLVLWSGPRVVISYAEWHKLLTPSLEGPKAATMIGMVDFFLALRADLGLSNKGISRDHIVRFLLKEPELFMQMYRANPNVLFSEIAETEEILRKKQANVANLNP